MTDSDTTIEQLVARAKQLYSLPAVAMEVLELTNNPQVDVRALKECIENDPALTTKLLRVVNSSLFGLSREVSDLNQALALLGTKPLKLLVLGFSLPVGLFAGIQGEILEHYWRHTLTKAVAGREISETFWEQPGDDSFIAGLLQDLAVLLLIQELGEPYARLLEKALADGKNLFALETESMGFDHTALSARLLGHWGLPDALVQTVQWNVDPRTAEEMPESIRHQRQILHLAELVARLLADGQSDVLGELLAVGRQYRDLTRQQLDPLAGNLEETVRQLADVLSLQLPEGLDYRDILAEAHRQLSDVAASVAEDLVSGGVVQEADSSGVESLADEVQSLRSAVARFSAADGAPHHSSAKVGSVKPSPATATEVIPSSRPAAGRVDPGLIGHLTAAVGACRQSRCPLSLVLVELNDTDSLILSRGIDGAQDVRRLVESICANVDHPYTTCLPYNEFGFALILADCDRQAAVGLGNQLIGGVGRLSTTGPAPVCQPISISVGAASVALPPKNFPAQDLLESAARCLYGSHASGGGVVKSIEIY